MLSNAHLGRIRRVRRFDVYTPQPVLLVDRLQANFKASVRGCTLAKELEQYCKLFAAPRGLLAGYLSIVYIDLYSKVLLTQCATFNFSQTPEGG